ncbi:MAG TPA: hypothetical protein VFF67_02260 [Thermoplasmata archaeon]|nr:hypothetical protein [Thermoplasmata archaeon]
MRTGSFDPGALIRDAARTAGPRLGIVLASIVIAIPLLTTVPAAAAVPITSHSSAAPALPLHAAPAPRTVSPPPGNSASGSANPWDRSGHTLGGDSALRLLRPSVARGMLPPPPPGASGFGQCAGPRPAAIALEAVASSCFAYDEASMSFYSTVAGGGGNVTWTVILPTDAGATHNQSDLYSAVWFGLPAVAPTGWLDECYIELQLYPDASWFAPGPGHPSATVAGNWVGQVVGWEISTATGSEDVCFQAHLLRTGGGGLPLNLTQGDTLRISFSGYASNPAGELVTVDDTTSGATGSVTLYNATGHFPVDPASNVNAGTDALLWSTGGGGGVSVGFELGRGGNPSIVANNSFGGCSPGVPPATEFDPSVPCPSYDPVAWTNDTGRPWEIQPPVFGTGSGAAAPTQVDFTQNAGGAAAVVAYSNGTCAPRLGSYGCSYPWFSYSCLKSAFEFGATDFAGVAADFGEYLEYAQLPVANALGLSYYGPTNYSIPACGGAAFTLGLSVASGSGGTIEFLNQSVGRSATFRGLPPGTYAVHAQANRGTYFAGWLPGGGATVGSATSAWTTVVLASNGSVKASFAITPETEEVWFNATPSLGAVDVIPFLGNASNAVTVPAGGHTVLVAERFTIQAAPPPGYVFGHWTVTGAGAAVDARNLPVTGLLITGSVPTAGIVAHYVRVATRATVEILGIGNGTITFNGSVVPYYPSNRTSFAVVAMAPGTYAASASPASGWTFFGWNFTPSGVLTNFSLATNLTLENGTTTLTATFGARVTFLVGPAGSGLISLNGRPPLANGTVEILPPGAYYLNGVSLGGYAFKRWNASDPAAAWVHRPGVAVSLLQLNASVTIDATFARRTLQNVTFHVVPAAAGTIQFDLINTYHDNATNSTVTNGSFIIGTTPGYAYRFVAWNTTGPATVGGGLAAIAGNGSTITAIFTLRLFSVTYVSTSSNGASSATINGTVIQSGKSAHLPVGTYPISTTLPANTTFLGWTSSLPIGNRSAGSSRATVTVTGAGTLYALTVNYAITNVTATPSTVDVGVPVTFQTSALGTGPFVFGWRNLPSGCGAATGPNVSCRPVSAGSFPVQASVTGPADVTVTTPVLPYAVVTGPAVTAFTASPAVFDQGNATTLTLAATGGLGAYTFTYPLLPPGCMSANASSLPCTPSAAGTYPVTAEATDGQGQSGFANTSITVNPDPSIVQFTAKPSEVTVGISTTLTFRTAGGTGALAVRFTGLPAGCLTVSTTTLSCTPTSAGADSISITVRDADGSSASQSLVLTVNPAPTIASFAAAPTAIFLGSPANFSASAGGGTGGLTLNYSGLPPGCVAGNVTSFTCVPGQTGAYSVTLRVNDTYGVSATATTNLTVQGLPTSPGGKSTSITESPWLLYALIGGIVAAAAFLAYLLRPRRRSAGPTRPTPGAPRSPPPPWQEP